MVIGFHYNYSKEDLKVGLKVIDNSLFICTAITFKENRSFHGKLPALWGFCIW